MLLPCFCLAFQEMQQLTSTSAAAETRSEAARPAAGLSGLKLPDLQLLKPDLQLPSLQWPDLKLPQQKLTGLNLFFCKKFKNSTRILNMKIL